MKAGRVALGLILLATGGGCTNEVQLPVVPSVAGGPEILCAPAQLMPFRLVVAIDRSPPVWGEWQSGGRFDIVWPPGFRLQLGGASAAIVDGDGHVVARSGDLIENAGGSAGEPVTICSINGRTYPLS